MFCRGRTTLRPVRGHANWPTVGVMIAETKILFDAWIAAVAKAINLAIGRYARPPADTAQRARRAVFTATAEVGAKGRYCLRFRSASRTGAPIPVAGGLGGGLSG